MRIEFSKRKPLWPAGHSTQVFVALGQLWFGAGGGGRIRDVIFQVVLEQGKTATQLNQQARARLIDTIECVSSSPEIGPEAADGRDGGIVT